MSSEIPFKDIGNGIWCVANQIFASNTYICRSEVSGECFIVDPGLDALLIESCLEKLSLKPRHIFCTHGHFDHIGSASFFQNKYEAKVYLHDSDVKTMQASNFLLMAFKIKCRIEVPVLENISGLEYSVNIGDQIIQFRLVPGHTAGSCIVSYGSAIFTGDSLYSRGMGFSRLPGERPEQLRSSLLTIWDEIPLDSTIYPGHGTYATFDWIRQNNHALIDFINSPYMPQKRK